MVEIAYLDPLGFKYANGDQQKIFPPFDLCASYENFRRQMEIDPQFCTDGYIAESIDEKVIKILGGIGPTVKLDNKTKTYEIIDEGFFFKSFTELFYQIRGYSNINNDDYSGE